MFYPVTLTKDHNGSVLVTFPDVPDAVTFGATIGEALNRAVDALLTVFDAYMKDRRDIPTPSSAHGRPVVALPALDVAKLKLYQAMRSEKVNKSELAKRLDWHLPQVDRVLKIHHASQLDQLEAAFAALGKRLIVDTIDLARPQTKQVTRTRSVHGPTGMLLPRSRPERASQHRASSSPVVRRLAAKKR